jgi:hypothetical protein
VALSLFSFFLFHVADCSCSAALLGDNAAETQGEHECSLLRVKGTKQIFSCYQIGENVCVRLWARLCVSILHCVLNVMVTWCVLVVCFI